MFFSKDCTVEWVMCLLNSRRASQLSFSPALSYIVSTTYYNSFCMTHNNCLQCYFLFYNVFNMINSVGTCMSCNLTREYSSSYFKTRYLFLILMFKISCQYQFSPSKSLSLDNWVQCLSHDEDDWSRQNVTVAGITALICTKYPEIDLIRQHLTCPMILL